MDLIEIDKKLQNEFANNKISIEKLAFDNILKAKSIQLSKQMQKKLL